MKDTRRQITRLRPTIFRKVKIPKHPKNNSSKTIREKYKSSNWIRESAAEAGFSNLELKK
jgi:hypothetical protein